MTLRTLVEKFYSSTLFVATEMELRSCFHDYESGLSVLVDNFYKESKVKELYLNLSDGSSLYFARPPKSANTQNMETSHIPSLLTKIEDKMGRSEAFLAGLAISKASKANQVQSMYLGAIFAAIHSSKIGNEPVQLEEIFHLLDQRKEIN